MITTEEMEMLNKVATEAGQSPLSYMLGMCDSTDTDLLEGTKALIEAKAEVNAKDRKGNRPLHMAADKGFFEIIPLLVEMKALVNVSNALGTTALLACLSSDNKTTTNQMLTVRMLLEYNADPTLADRYQKTPLHYAAMNREIVDIIPFLLERKALVNAKDYFGITPLIEACTKGSNATVRILLEAKANINDAGNDNETSLYRAFNRKEEFIGSIILLLEQHNHLGKTKLFERGDHGWQKFWYVHHILFPCFNPKNMYLMAQDIELAHLKVEKEDHLLSNRVCNHDLIHDYLEKVKGGFLLKHEEEWKGAASFYFITEQGIDDPKVFMENLELVDEETRIELRKKLQTIQDFICEKLIKVIVAYLKTSFLYKRQAEVFWKPYFDLLIFEGPLPGQEVLPNLLPAPLSELVVEYYPGGNGDLTSEIYIQKPINQDKELFNLRLNWIKEKILNKKNTISADVLACTPHDSVSSSQVKQTAELEKKNSKELKQLPIEWLCSDFMPKKLQPSLNHVSPCSPLIYAFGLQQQCYLLVDERQENKDSNQDKNKDAKEGTATAASAKAFASLS